MGRPGYLRNKIVRAIVAIRHRISRNDLATIQVAGDALTRTMIMHAGFMRTTAAVRGRRYGTTDEALFGRVPLGGSYGCPKEHLMNRGRSGLLGIGPPHVTAGKGGSGLNFTQSEIRSQPLRHEPYCRGPFSTANHFAYRISRRTGMPLSGLLSGPI